MSGTHPPGASVFQCTPTPLEDPDKPSYGPHPDMEDYDSEDDKPLKQPTMPKNKRAPRKSVTPKTKFKGAIKAKRSLDKAMDEVILGSKPKGVSVMLPRGGIVTDSQEY